MNAVPAEPVTLPTLLELLKADILKQVQDMDPAEKLLTYHLLIAFSNQYVFHRERIELKIHSQAFTEVAQNRIQDVLVLFNKKLLGHVHARHTRSFEKCALALDMELMPFLLDERQAILEAAIDFERSKPLRQQSQTNDES
jgi:hypothetical protein